MDYYYIFLIAVLLWIVVPEILNYSEVRKREKIFSRCVARSNFRSGPYIRAIENMQNRMGYPVSLEAKAEWEKLENQKKYLYNNFIV